MVKGSQWLRLIAASGLIGLFVWLWVSGRKSERRWGDAVFVTAHVRPLAATEGVSLQTELAALLKAAGGEAPFTLNAPRRPGMLAVFVTRAAQFGETGCRPGDARYDPYEDVIMLDEGVIKPLLAVVGYSTVGVLTAGDDNSAATTWRRFVVLHEVGHRVLHRAALTRWRRSSQQMEDEADRFAFQAFANLPGPAAPQPRGISGSTSVLETKAAANLPPAERALVQMAAVIQDLSVTLLFSNAHFSTFHADSSHAAFAQRFRTRLHEARARSLDRITETYLLLAQEYLERLERVGTLLITEIQSQSPIQSVTLDDGDVVVEAGEADQRSQAWRLRADTWRSRGTSGAVRLWERNVEEGWTTPASSQRETVSEELAPNVLRTWPSTGPARWEVRQSDGAVLQSRAEDEILSELRRLLFDPQVLSQCTITAGSGGTGAVPVTITCYNDVFVGMVTVPALELTDIHALRLPRPLSPPAWRTVVDVIVAGERRFYLIVDTLTEEHTRPFELQVWRLASFREPRRIASHALAMEWIPTGAKMDDWFRISHPPLVACSTLAVLPVLCTQYQDAVFSFDPISETISVLFYPAGTPRLRLPDGAVAFWAKGGYKVFIIRPPGGTANTKTPASKQVSEES